MPCPSHCCCSLLFLPDDFFSGRASKAPITSRAARDLEEPPRPGVNAYITWASTYQLLKKNSLPSFSEEATTSLTCVTLLLLLLPLESALFPATLDEGNDDDDDDEE